MTYKDPDKQREANREASKRYREAKKLTLAKPFLMTLQGETPIDIAQGMTDETAVIPERVIPKRTAQGNIRVSKPGDADYVPMCETTRAFIGGSSHKTDLCPYCLERPIMSDNAIACEECSQKTLIDAPHSKRGKDIKCFADLPLDVQQTIDRMSIVDGKIDHTLKANRTAIAINYQHLFPDRYYSTGIAI